MVIHVLDTSRHKNVSSKANDMMYPSLLQPVSRDWGVNFTFVEITMECTSFLGNDEFYQR